jgi:hypothetical protein
MIELDAGRVACAEIRWYEAHGIGKVKLKAISSSPFKVISTYCKI